MCPVSGFQQLLDFVLFEVIDLLVLFEVIDLLVLFEVIDLLLSNMSYLLQKYKVDLLSFLLTSLNIP